MRSLPACAAALITLLGCSGELGSLGSERLPIVYDDDSRQEYFEIDDEVLQARLARSSVALVADRYLDLEHSRLRADAPTWAERDGVCLDQRFAEQPDVAFCSGVLVDWDLVLTAGHCLRVLDPADFSVVFGYYFREPGELALGRGDVMRGVEILSEALDPEGAEPRLDFGWLRVAHSVSSSFEPAPIHTRAPSLKAGDVVTTIGSASGVPLKLDRGAVESADSPDDFFVARTDTSGGWSGGGAYDANHALVGILARGASDLEVSADDCRVEVRVDATQPSEEQYTYAASALAKLCESEPARAVCQPTCGDPCQAPALPQQPEAAGCAFQRIPEQNSFVPLLLLAVSCGLRRARRSAVTSRAAGSGPGTVPGG